MWASVSTTCPLYETELPNALIRRARADGVEAAMRLLRAVLAVEEVPFFRIMPVWGLSVEKPTWTADDVCVAPMHTVPWPFASRLFLRYP